MSQPTDEAMEVTSNLACQEPLRHPQPQEGAAASEHKRDLPQQMQNIFKVC